MKTPWPTAPFCGTALAGPNHGSTAPYDTTPGNNRCKQSELDTVSVRCLQIPVLPECRCWALQIYPLPASPGSAVRSSTWHRFLSAIQGTFSSCAVQGVNHRPARSRLLLYAGGFVLCLELELSRIINEFPRGPRSTSEGSRGPKLPKQI